MIIHINKNSLKVFSISILSYLIICDVNFRNKIQLLRENVDNFVKLKKMYYYIIIVAYILFISDNCPSIYT